MGKAWKHAVERRDVHTKFWLEEMKGRDILEDLCADKRTILNWILKKMGGGCGED
jgi:hypothetical protein